jgi:predicted RNA-binding protein Jag
VLKELWQRLTAGREAAAAKRAQELQQMSPEERHIVEERFEDRQADLESEAHLGGADPHLED